MLACLFQTAIGQWVHVLEVFSPIRLRQIKHLFCFPVHLTEIAEAELSTNAYISIRKSLWSFWYRSDWLLLSIIGKTSSLLYCKRNCWRLWLPWKMVVFLHKGHTCIIASYIPDPIKGPERPSTWGSSTGVIFGNLV